MPMTIYKPDRTPYELITEGEGQNVFTAEVENAEGNPEMSVLIDIPVEENMAGTWEIVSGNYIDFSIAGVKTAPEIKNVTVTEEENGQFTAHVEFTGETNAYADTLDLYIINDEPGRETSLCLLENQPVSGTVISHTFEVPELFPTSSNYKIAAVLNNYEVQDGERDLYSATEKNPILLR